MVVIFRNTSDAPLFNRSHCGLCCVLAYWAPHLALICSHICRDVECPGTLSLTTLSFNDLGTKHMKVNHKVGNRFITCKMPSERMGAFMDHL